MAYHVPVPITLGTSLTLHFLVFSATWVKMVGASSGVVEVDLIFPRNETYAPTAYLPIIFAFQNSHLAPFLDPLIHIDAYLVQNANGSTPQWAPPESIDLEQLRWANFTNNDTYFAYPTYQRNEFTFATEGIWQVTWTFNWAVCTEDSLANNIFIRNESQRTTTLTIRKDAQEVDLVSGTMGKSCSGQDGVAVNITNTLHIPSSAHWEGQPDKWEGQGDMCASTASSVPKSDPCRVSIDPAAAASISCSITFGSSAANFSTTTSSLTCPEDKKSAAGCLTVGGLATLFGVFSYLLH
ncbi:hypothetical protein AA0120_g6250 [Alternaria tenuissima]|jgi:hypothetical protein|nr:hypothetical protein AA0120_g6250 [Alternaria tenuissima]